MDKYYNILKRIILTVLAMGGIIIDKITLPRTLLIILMIGIYLLFKWLYKEADFTESVIIFSLVFICRYIFLFFSFVKNGIANYLKNIYGEYTGFEIYRIITAMLFFLSASGFSLLIYKSKFALPLYNQYNWLFVILGTIAIVVGITINVWSTLLIGVDVYYYKDLFLGKVEGEFKKAGPYAVLANPMYSLGQANGYGSALIYGSIVGIVFILLNQIMMYIFYLTIEKPHIKKVFG